VTDNGYCLKVSLAAMTGVICRKCRKARMGDHVPT